MNRKPVGVMALLLLAALASVVRAQSGPGHLWRLDGNLADAIGTNHGTAVGGTLAYTNGQFAQAGVLAGSTCAEVGVALSTSAYTKAAWIFRTGGTSNSVIGGDNSTNRHAFGVPANQGYVLCAGHQGVWTNVRDSVAIATGVWTHVAVTYDQAEQGGTLRIYRNGLPCGGTPVATNVAPPNGGLCLIGGHNYGSYFTGRMDDVALWDRVLSAAEIKQLYRAGQHDTGLPSATNWQDAVYGLVPDLAGYDVVYEYPIPTVSALGTTGQASYLWDGSGGYSNEFSFDRVAYYVEVGTNGTATSHWVCVSADAFTHDAKEIGIPSIASGAQFQQRLAGMNVYAGGGYVVTGTNLQTGNIEFWGCNYSANNAAGVPGASSSTSDFGDQNSGSGTYGSMQIHNHGAAQTVFAYNRWGIGGGDSDLGIGNDPNTGRANYNPDWTFATNAATYATRRMLVLARPAIVPQVTMIEFPKPLQVYPRDLATGQGTVVIRGIVTTPGCSNVTVAVKRAGVPFTNVVQSLGYSNGEAAFVFNVPITAELASYDFTVLVWCQGADRTVASVSDIVAGDVYLINGQSNAEAALRSGSANGNQTTWVRSYGYRSSSGAEVRADEQWHLAEGDIRHGAGAVGQWGLRLGAQLVQKTGIPVCIINNAEGGQAIAYFQRNDNDPVNAANNNYGQLLYRAQKAGVQNAVRAILWYQGESDYSDPGSHEAGWLRLYQGWRRDYPSLEKIYVCQIHAACGMFMYTTADLRDRQRRFGDLDPTIEIMSETAVPQHTDDCHYAYTGYQIIGNNLTRMLARDLYGQNGLNVEPPNPAYAYFNASHREVRIEMRNTADTVTWDAGAHADFRLQGASATPTNGYATAHTVVLQFNQDVSAATNVSYVSHWGQTGPYVTNANGVGLLAFQMPILAADPGGSPAAPSSVQIIPVSSNRIDIAWGTQTGAVSYLVRRDGTVIGTTSSDHYVDYDVQPGQGHVYQVAAVGSLSTSAWSLAAGGTTVAHNVFAVVPEAAGYQLLYALDLANDFSTGASLDLPYGIDNSGSVTSTIVRVAYFMELQDAPGHPLAWVYASMRSFTNDASALGVPVALKGATFQRNVHDMNVYASGNTSVTTGLHIGTGNIEFWAHDYAPANAVAVPGASDLVFDAGDQPGAGAGRGSMQLHNHGAGQTLFAFNSWGATGLDDVGIGNRASSNTDWTAAASAPGYNVKRLYVLVQTTNGPPPVSTYTWTNTAGGAQAWTTAGNWLGGFAPDPDVGDTMDFSTVDIAADTTLSLGADRTATTWLFDDTTGTQNWVVTGAGRIALEGATATVAVARNTVTFSTAVSGSTGLTKSGGGSLVLSGANTCSGALGVLGGELDLNNWSGVNVGGITVQNTGSVLRIATSLTMSGGTTFTMGGGSGSGPRGTVNHVGGIVTMPVSGGNMLLINGGAVYNLDGGALVAGAGSASRGVMLGVNANSGSAAFPNTFNLLGGSLDLYANPAILQVGRSDSANVTNTFNLYHQTGGNAAVGTLTIGGKSASSNNAVSSTFLLTGGSFSATNFPYLANGIGDHVTMLLGATAQVTLPAFGSVGGRDGAATASITFDFTSGHLAPAAASGAYIPAGTFNSASLTTNGVTFAVAGGNDITVGQDLVNAPSQAGTLKKTGSGTLLLAGTNTYSGATIITAGQLVGVTGGSCSNSAVTVADGATNGVRVLAAGQQWTCAGLAYNAGTTHAAFDFGAVAPSTNTAPLQVNGNLDIGGTLQIVLSGSALVGGQTYPLIAYTGTLSGSLPAMPQSMPPHLTGSITQLGKTIYVTVASREPLTWQPGNGTWDATSQNWKDVGGVTAAYIDGAPGDAVVFDNTPTGAGPFTVTLDNVYTPESVTNNSSKNYTISGGGGIGGSAGLTKLGTGTLTLSVSNTYGGATTVGAGTLKVGTAGAIPANGVLNVTGGLFDLNDNNVTATPLPGHVAGTISNSAGAATLTLNVSGTNILFNPALKDGGGTLGVVFRGPGSGDNRIVSLAGGVSNTFGGGLTLTRYVWLNSVTSGLGSGAIVVGTNASDRAQIYVSGTAAITNPFVVNTALGSTGPTVAGTFGGYGGTVTLSGGITVNAGVNASFVCGNANTFNVSGKVGGAGGLTIGSAGWTVTVVLTNTSPSNLNDFAGGVTIAGYANVATLKLGADNQIPDTADVTLNGQNQSSYFDLAGHADTIDGLATSGGNTFRAYVQSSGGSGVLRIGAHHATAAFDGVLQNGTGGSLALVKLGTGTQTLSRACTYSGPTAVSNGALIVTGSIGTGAVTVASGATLGGTGTIGGPVTSSGILAPGASPGLLTLSRSYTQNSNGTLRIEIGGLTAGTHYDRLVVSNTATLGGTLAVVLTNGFVPVVGHSFVILQAASLGGTTFATTNLPAIGTNAWVVTYLANTAVVLSVTNRLPATGYDLWAGAITNGMTNYNQSATQDGYPNLLKYATGSSPTNSDHLGRVSATNNGGTLAFEFNWNTNSTDVSLIVEGSSAATDNAMWAGIASNMDGAGWSSTSATIATNLATVPPQISVRLINPGGTNRFLRLRVTQP